MNFCMNGPFNTCRVYSYNGAPMSPCSNSVSSIHNSLSRMHPIEILSKNKLPFRKLLRHLGQLNCLKMSRLTGQLQYNRNICAYGANAVCCQKCQKWSTLTYFIENAIEQNYKFRCISPKQCRETAIYIAEVVNH